MSEPLLEPGLIGIKLGTYGVGAGTAIKDPRIVPTVQNYKRQIASRMFPLGRHDIDRKVADAEYYVSRKIDGEFTVCVFQDGQIYSVNPGGTVRVGMPWQKEALEILKAANVDSALFAGELHKEIDGDRRCRVHDVISSARQPKSEQDLQSLHFAVFDLIAINGETVDQPYAETWTKIEELFSGGSKIQPVETVKVKGRKAVKMKFDEWVDKEKAEGIVVRSDVAGNFKIKPLHTLDALVLGFTESTDDREGMLHDLLLGIVREDGAVQVMCRVGGGFSDDDRRGMLSDLKDMVVESEYAEVNSDHVAYQMVRPEWVIEITCLDIISQNTRGGPINRMVLNWNHETDAYEVVRRLPLVSIISPQFVRIREDKKFNKDDVRIAQITNVVPVQKVDVNATELKLSTSSVLKREVYTKTLKGKLMVRKFLMWKTNKENEGSEYPAYVVHYTDYSPGRKVPLDREVRISNSEQQINDLFEQLKKDNIKKGWAIQEPDAKA
ncbi:ATP dependent DNA ligase [Mariniblastus fucicola]|uniref:DNA ligase (ATP) n=1 Tax=Mariniblastus fucicola TaxID=980251 RepID=A0A5B9P7Z7_9BACT|nr:ATP-dependent DNA ligase [Mariniblastus fucicola]QEG22418.1 ATP-dependent DNA ligase [Mariniblastus fucicola]